MKVRHAVLVAFAAAVTLTSVAAAGPDAARQQVQITFTGVANPASPSSGKVVLTPLSPGSLEPDSGKGLASVIANKRTVTRDGQRAEIVTWVDTYKGKRGSFVVRTRIEHIDAGNGFHIGTGTWRFVRGTGAYAGITGGGQGRERLDRLWIPGPERAAGRFPHFPVAGCTRRGGARSYAPLRPAVARLKRT
jgi:hypothetical protein